MSLARILSRTQLGLEAPLMQVELHVGRGLPGFTIVGLPAPVVRESRDGHAAAYGAATLREAATWLAEAPASAMLRPQTIGGGAAAAAAALPVLADVAGQWQAKRTLIIAAAGGHSVLIAFTSFPAPVSMPAGRAAPCGNQQRPYSARRATRRSAPSGNQCSRPVCPRRAIGVPLGRAPLDDGRESVWDHVAVQHRPLTLDGVPDQLLAELRLPRERRVPISRRRHQIPPWLPGAAHSHASNHERQRQCSYCCQQFPKQSSSSAV
jgi:hypothetical protein